MSKSEQLSFEQALRAYDYAYPRSAVALTPAEPRDSAKLLVYDRSTGKTEVDTFAHLGRQLPKGAVLVINETKVVSARVEFTKTTGGKVRLLFVRIIRTNEWVALADRALKKGERLICGSSEAVVLSRSTEGYRVLVRGLTGLEKKHGQIPLPPYLRHSPLTEAQRRRAYQTVFAHTTGSIAAPTASLHFTKRLLTGLQKSGIEIAKITLHVSLGTFAALTQEQWESGKLHAEEFTISAVAAKSINQALKEKRPVIAVGTTVARTLESAYANKKVRAMHGTTRLFIRPGYKCTVVDGLITNFHVPRSSLLMLVASLVGRERLLNLYQFAIKRGFRLFSFGDAMLIRG
ncbi:MAG: tRNA preQ1(34) S-adenosylmethionine ribosyltransferase-isomerase QueA [Candidatus Andersenbacteria bacterium]